MGKKERFIERTGANDSLGGHLVGYTHKTTVDDTDTKNRGEGTGRTREESRKEAWDNLRDKQGPHPSERKRD